MDPITIAMGLAQFAPQLVGWITGSKDAAAGAQKVVDLAGQVTGKLDPSAALAALQADKTLQIQFQQAVMANDADLTKAFLSDVQDARKMQTAALAQDDRFSKRFVYYFAAAWSLFTMVYFGCVTFIGVPATGQRVADTILGVLISSVIGGIMGYFYGSTKGSADKTDKIISTLTK